MGRSLRLGSPPIEFAAWLSRPPETPGENETTHITLRRERNLDVALQLSDRKLGPGFATLIRKFFVGLFQLCKIGFYRLWLRFQLLIWPKWRLKSFHFAPGFQRGGSVKRNHSG